MNHPIQVVSIYMRRHHKLFLSQRLDAGLNVGKYQTAGGRMEQGEMPAQAAARELQEETGIYRDPTTLKFIGRLTEYDAQGNPYDVHAFVTEITTIEEPQRTEPDKAGEWNLYDEREIRVMNCIPGLQRTALWLISLEGKGEDKRAQKHWWAPGGYTQMCHLCGCRFVGDKRAGHCADCAYDESRHPNRAAFVASVHEFESTRRPTIFHQEYAASFEQPSEHVQARREHRDAAITHRHAGAQ